MSFRWSSQGTSGSFLQTSSLGVVSVDEFIHVMLSWQALNNLGSVYVDCNKLDLAADCYVSALEIKHTRAHQGLARVYHLKNDRKSAYEEMTKLIDKAQNKASAYEKRSEYCDRDMANNDLHMASVLDPLRTYPYRYRAAGTSSISITLPPLLVTNFFVQEEVAKILTNNLTVG